MKKNDNTVKAVNRNVRSGARKINTLLKKKFSVITKERSSQYLIISQKKYIYLMIS